MTLGVLIGLFVGAMLMYFYNSRREQKKEEITIDYHTERRKQEGIC